MVCKSALVPFANQTLHCSPIQMVIESKKELATLVSETVALFLGRYGIKPAWIAVAPGRVNLIGDHVDYNDGFVLPVAIEKYSVAVGAMTGSETTVSRVYSVQMDASFEFDSSATLTPTQSGWEEYIKGVVHGFQSLGTSIPPMQMMVNSSVPVGSGLSSSAALEVSIATLLASACNQPLDKKQTALLCQNAEIDFANVPCGAMDQFISVFGKDNHALLLDCRDLSFRQIPFDQSEVALLIINSNVSHQLGNSQYAIRRKRCESACQKLDIKSLRSLDMETLQTSREKLDQLEFQRCKHVVSENARTISFAEHLQNKQWQLAGQLMFQSHDSLRDDYEVSCFELDVLVELAKKIGPSGGVYGSRMTGGGFGGSTVSLVKRELVESIARRIVEQYEVDSRIQQQATAFYTSPVTGARLLENVAQC